MSSEVFKYNFGKRTARIDCAKCRNRKAPAAKFINNEERLKRDQMGQEMRRALHKIPKIDVKADEN